MDPAPVRRDVARNRRALLDAARAVVAEHGPDVPLDEIARAAGVSRTTLHRHFADRDALAAAVLRENVEDIEAWAAELAGRADGAEVLFHRILDVQVGSPWLARLEDRARAGGEAGPGELGDLATRTRAALAALVPPAAAAGTLRPGVTAEDLLLAMPMMMAALEVARRTPGQGELARARRILHAGLFTTPAPRGSGSASRNT